MKTSDTLKWGIRGIRQRKLRAALTILGIMVGTAAVIALVSQTDGIQVSIVSEINKLGPTSIIVRPSSVTTTLTDSDVNRILQMPNVDYVVPVIMSNIRVYGAGTSKSYTLVGVDPAQFQIILEGVTFEEGRMYQQVSYSEMVVGCNVRYPQDLTVPLVTVGQSATVGIGFVNPIKKQMNVVGAFEQYGSSSLVSVDDSVFVSIKSATTLLGQTGYTTLFVKASSPDTVDSVVRNIRATYGTSITYFTVKQITQIVSSVISQLTVLLGAIAAISLLVAGLGIMNIMFVSVIERTKEIGVLKALGFKRRNILGIFLSEATIMGIVGGVLGIVLGTALSYIIPIILTSAYSVSTGTSTQLAGQYSGVGGMGSFLTYAPIIRPEIVLLVLVFGISVSLLAGFYPATRASKMDPVVALRHE